MLNRAKFITDQESAPMKVIFLLLALEKPTKVDQADKNERFCCSGVPEFYQLDDPFCCI
jgi:hypothetical protein